MKCTEKSCKEYNKDMGNYCDRYFDLSNCEKNPTIKCELDVKEVCTWDNSDPIRYKTSCGETSGIEPEYHEGMKYCPYCGLLMKVKD